MKRLILVLTVIGVLLLIYGYAHAQEAVVVPLSVSDAEQARETWDALQTAQRNWEAVQKHIALTYLVVPPNDPDASETHYAEPVSITGNASSGSLILGSTVTAGVGCIHNDANGNVALVGPCDDSKPTPEQIAARKLVEDRQAEEEKARQKRYAQEKRQRRGFEGDCSNCLPKFEFSHDFKFIVPPKAAPVPSTSPFWNATPVPLIVPTRVHCSTILFPGCGSLNLTAQR